MVLELGRRCKDPVAVARELRPEWRGYLLVDGKPTKIRGEAYTYLIAGDCSRDIVDGVLAWGEDRDSLTEFFEQIKDEIGYRPLGVVSDAPDAHGENLMDRQPVPRFTTIALISLQLINRGFDNSFRVANSITNLTAAGL